jgi:hypothetical protein
MEFFMHLWHAIFGIYLKANQDTFAFISDLWQNDDQKLLTRFDFIHYVHYEQAISNSFDILGMTSF